MKKKRKNFFQREENRRAILVSLLVALIVLTADIVKRGAEWLFVLVVQIDDPYLAETIGFGVAAIILIIFIRIFQGAQDEI